jgi:4-amino-4-deoxy-L-arabinose transferase-like glycosyltransferase
MKYAELTKRNTYLILAIIILLAAVLRLWGLGAIPASPDWDEVAHGYNAYSILHTGKDEYGKFLPIILRSYDDYKPALFTYLSIPPIAIFGLNVFAVRLPSAVFGILAVVAVFYLLRLLFKRDDLALLSTGILAISPWHIQFSRVAFESNVGGALNIFAALFFLKGLKKPWLLTLSAVSAGLSFYAYQSEKVFVPLFIALLIAVYFKTLKHLDKKKLVIAAVTFLIVLMPMFLAISTDKDVLARAKGASIFSSKDELLKSQVQVLKYDTDQNNFIGKLLDNRRVLYLKTFLAGYIAHYDPNWLLHGDNPRHHAPDMGLIYFWELPFILIGIYALLFGAFDKRTKILIFGWFLLAPIPASITTGVPHAVRTLNFLPTWQIFSALGIWAAYIYVKDVIHNGLIRKTVYTLFSVIVFSSFIYYLNQYFIQQNYFHAFDWQYGYAQAVDDVQKIEGNYKKVIVSNERPLDNSYMFFLFYTKYDPAKYQSERHTASDNTQHSFAKYEFRPIQWDKDKNPDVLFIGRQQDFPNIDKALDIIRYPDGKPAMYVIKYTGEEK